MIVLLGFAANSIREEANISMYSESPITVDCAYRAIAAMDGVTSAVAHKYAIKFEGWGFSGQLFHGTEGEPFVNYGLDVGRSFLVSDDMMTIAAKVGGSLRDTCGP